MKTITYIRIHENRGEDVQEADGWHIKVTSHKSNPALVVIEATEDLSFAVATSDLLLAIKNAKRVNAELGKAIIRERYLSPETENEACQKSKR